MRQIKVLSANSSLLLSHFFKLDNKQQHLLNRHKRVQELNDPSTKQKFENFLNFLDLKNQQV